MPIDQVTFSFGRALEELRARRKVARAGWHEIDKYIALQVPDEHSKMTRPYIYVVEGTNTMPYNVSDVDMFTDDWFIIG